MFPLIIGAGIVTELIRDVLRFVLDNETKQYALFHFYIPFEFFCICFYFYLICESKRIQLFISVSAVLFFLSSPLMSVFLKTLNEFPSVQYNISGLLITIISIMVLINLPVKFDVSIYRRPTFWFCIAFSIFYPGQFLLNGYFSYIEKNKPLVLESLPRILYFGFNYLLYILITIGFLCLIPKRKYFIQ